MRSNFTLEIITLRGREVRQVSYLKLRDESGSFGIMRNHGDFLTVIEPGLGYYRDIDGKIKYIATDGGFLIIHRGCITLCAYEYFEGESPEEIVKLVKERIEKKREIEERYRKLATEIEEIFLKRALELYKT